jgi:hypothetical protein
MYADDMALVSETIPDLQKAVDLLSSWAHTKGENWQNQRELSATGNIFKV